MGRIFAPKRPTTGEQVEEFYKARGNVWTGRAFSSLPIITHPNDEYLRVPPDGPFTQAWQGVQKDDPIAALGTTWQTQRNPLQSVQEQLARINLNNPAAFSVGAGPDLYAAQDSQYAAQALPRVTLLQAIMARIRG